MKTAVPRVGMAAVPKARMTARERKNQIEGLLFVSPWIIGFLTLTLFPLLFSGYISLTRYDLLRPPVFIGFANYTEIFFRDPTFWAVMGNTFFFVLFSVPLSLGFSFLVANLLNSNIVGQSFWRAVMYIPSIVPAVCTAMVWLFLLNIQYGAINGMLQWLGLRAIPFLSNPALAKPSLIMVAIWSTGNAVVIFLAGLQDVPRSLYEAATVDGANAWHRFRQCHDPDEHAGDPVQSVYRLYQRLSRVYLGAADHQRRPGQRDAVLFAVPVPPGVPVLAHGQGLRAGLDPVPDGRDLQPDPVSNVGTLGVLRR